MSEPTPEQRERTCGPCSRGQHAACDGPNEFWGDCTCTHARPPVSVPEDLAEAIEVAKKLIQDADTEAHWARTPTIRDEQRKLATTLRVLLAAAEVSSRPVPDTEDAGTKHIHGAYLVCPICEPDPYDPRERIRELEQINSQLARYLDAAGLLDQFGNYIGPVPSQTPEPTDAHGMLPGTHESPSGPQCRCGMSWDYWNERCLSWFVADVGHVCEECPTCGMHEGRHDKCCGCYDGVCCATPAARVGTIPEHTDGSPA